MGKKTKLQTKLLVPVFVIVTLTVLSVTGVVTLLEKKRLQQPEFNQIYDESDALKNLAEERGGQGIGFSRQQMKHHLRVLIMGMLGIGFLVLGVTLAMIFWVIRKHILPLEQKMEERTRELQETNEKLSCQIQDRKEIESRLLTVQKLEAIGTLAGGIAHEFNNLFMAILGYASLIRKRVEPGHPNIEKAEKICGLVESGSQSIQQLLGFARSGRYAPGPLNLNEVLRQNLTIFGRSRKDLEVRAVYSPDLWMVHADRSQMEQVIMNLLLNASEAMPHPGDLHVETRNVILEAKEISLEKNVSGRFVLFCIKDEGRGIDSDILPRIFDPFFTTKHTGVGTGMGLAAVFGIVDNHGGFTTVDSQKGEGALFCVYLPALAAKAGS